MSHIDRLAQTHKGEANCIEASEMERLRALARDCVRLVWHDPLGRLAMHRAFYRSYGFGRGYGFGKTEVRFVEWAIQRGVFNPQFGSLWWKAVNGRCLYYVQLARLIDDRGAHAMAWDTPVRLWLDYIAQPERVPLVPGSQPLVRP